MNKCHITHVNTLCILYGGVICKVAMYIQHNRIKLVFSNFVHKFWLISVFVTNAKGGDCWNNDTFVISNKTYSVMNAYRAHHSAYSSYRAFNGYQAGSAVIQCIPSSSVYIEQFSVNRVVQWLPSNWADQQCLPSS